LIKEEDDNIFFLFIEKRKPQLNSIILSKSRKEGRRKYFLKLYFKILFKNHSIISKCNICKPNKITMFQIAERIKNT